MARDCVAVGLEIDRLIEVWFESEAHGGLGVQIESTFTVQPGFEGTPVGPTMEVEIATTGMLTIRSHRTGATITVLPHPDYEAWNVVLASGELFVCKPGGGVMHWDARA